MKKLISSLIAIFFILLLPCYADVATKQVVIQEVDGAPKGVVRTLKVTNGTLTQNSTGNYSLVTGGGAGGAPTDADYLVGTANGSLSAEIVVGTSPGGELGGTWASPTIDDSVAVTSWNLTTPTITTSLTTSTPTTISAAELDRLDGLTSAIIDDDKIDTFAELDTIVADKTLVETTTAFVGDVTGNIGATVVGNDSHDHSAAGSTVVINAADITDKNAGTDITADLEEEVSEGSLADSTIVSGDIKDGTIAGGDLATNIAITTTGLTTANGNLKVGNANTTAGVLTLLEDTDDGSNYASFMVPALTDNTVYTLPADDGGAGEQLQTNGSGVLSWEAAGSFDSTSVEATTWGAGGNASNIWSFNLSGTDTTLTWSSAAATFSHKLGIGATPWEQLTVSGGDAVISDTSPHLTLRDSSDNTAYQWHCDSADSTWGYLQLWRGTDDGTGFSVTPSTPLMYFDTSNNVGIPNNLTVSGTLTTPTITNNTNIKGQRFHIYKTIFDPLAVQTEDNEVCLVPSLDAAITITKIEVTLDATTNEVAGDLKYADTFIGLANATVINDFDTTSGVRSDSSITSGAVAAGKCIYLSFDSAPNTAIHQMCIDIQGDYD